MGINNSIKIAAHEREKEKRQGWRHRYSIGWMENAFHRKVYLNEEFNAVYNFDKGK